MKPRAFCPIRQILLGVISIVFFSAVVPAGQAPKPEALPAAWTWTTNLRILDVLNAGSSMRTPALGLESLEPTYFAVYRSSPRKYLFPGLGSTWPSFVSTPGGLIVVVLEDEGDSVRLVALESETGKVRWERGGLEMEDNCGYRSAGNLLLVRMRQEDKAKARACPFSLAAIDLRDGRLLWRNDQIPDKSFELICLPQLRILLMRTYTMGFLSWEARLYALDLDTGQIHWQVDLDQPTGEGFPLLAWEGERDAVADRYFHKALSIYYQDKDNFYDSVQRGHEIFLLSKENKRSWKSPDILERWDLDTGRITWKYPGINVFSLAVDEDRVYILTEARLVVLDHLTGKLLAEWSPGVEKTSRFSTLRGWQAPEAQFLVPDGDLLYIQRAIGELYRFKTVDIRSGTELWSIKPGKEAIRLVGGTRETLLGVSGTDLVRLDKRTGKRGQPLPIPFKLPLNAATVHDEQSVILQSDNQLARIDLSTGKEVFNTGEIPLPKAKSSAAGELLGALFTGAVAGVAGAYGSGAGGAWPGYAMTFALMQPGARFFGGGRRPTGGDAVRIHTMGSDNAFYLTVDGGTLHLLRIDMRDGEKTLLPPYHAGDDMRTVLDDFRGVCVEFRKKKAVAYRYPVRDEVRNANRFADAFAAGLEALRRSEGLNRAGLENETVAELRNAGERFQEALGLTEDPGDRMAVRYHLAAAWLGLAGHRPEQAEALRKQARDQLDQLLQAAGERTDERCRALIEAARKLMP